MNLRMVQKATAYAMAALGLLLLGISGEMGTLGNLIVVAGFIASWWAEEPATTSKQWNKSWNLVTAGFFILQFVRWWMGLGFVTSAVQFAAFLQLNKLFNRRNQTDFDHILVLSLLHLMGASILFSDIGYALVFFLYVIVTPWLLMLGQIRREVEAKYLEKKDAESMYNFKRVLQSRRLLSGKLLASTALLSIPIYIFTGFIFLIFPRIGFGILAGSSLMQKNSVGFSDTIILGDLVPLADNPFAVARVEFPDGPPDKESLGHVHWRATAYDTYDGAQWLRTMSFGGSVRGHGAYSLLAGDAPIDLQELGKKYLRLAITLRPIYPKVLIIPQETPYLEEADRQPIRSIRKHFSWGPSDEIRFSDPFDTGIGYTVFMSKDFARIVPPSPFRSIEAEEPGDLGKYLQLPSAMSGEFRELAADFVRRETDPLKRALAIEGWLSKSFKYTRSSYRKVPEGRKPIEAFLFDWKEGNCEYYSTAMVLLLRAGGVPARNVAGFLGGQWNSIGNYLVVREGDAHSWAEAWLPGRGWLIFDATPAASSPGARPNAVLGALLQFFDVLGLGWQKHVIAYDLSRQSRLVRAGYDELLRVSYGIRRLRGTARYGFGLEQKRVLAIIVMLVLWTVFFSTRRRQSPLMVPLAHRQTVSVKKAISLVAVMDKRLETLGLTRPPSRPPLAHGRRVSAQLKQAAALLDIVEIYNEARFGSRFISQAQFRSLVQRIKVLE